MEERTKEQVRILLGLSEADLAEGEERNIEVTLIRPGLSRNGLLYTEEVLR